MNVTVISDEYSQDFILAAQYAASAGLKTIELRSAWNRHCLDLSPAQIGDIRRARADNGAHVHCCQARRAGHHCLAAPAGVDRSCRRTRRVCRQHRRYQQWPGEVQRWCRRARRVCRQPRRYQQWPGEVQRWCRRARRVCRQHRRYQQWPGGGPAVVSPSTEGVSPAPAVPLGLQWPREVIRCGVACSTLVCPESARGSPS